MLRRHGAEWDTMGGNALPLRIEAIRSEAECHPFGEELIWRIMLIDEVFLAEEGKKKKREEARKKSLKK